jgi:gliding motility-associated-like protein
LFNTFSFSYGSNTNPLPTGTYTIKFTDSCGHTVTRNIDITNAPPFELFSVDQSTCLGMIRISTANLVAITAAVLTEAPESFEGTLPENVMEYVNGSSLQMENLPIGEYTFTITDACGQVFEVEVEIEAPIPNLNLYYGVMMGCEEGTGSFDVFASGIFTEIIITEAPESFGGTLPFNASSLLDVVGQLHMNNVPEGLYTFTTLDACGNVREGSLWAEGFELLSNTTTILPNCGSFDVDLQYSSNSVSYGTFWLQQYDEASGQWKHPETGMLYDPMSYPTESTAIPLQNYQINYSLQYSGQLRIIWAYYAYGDPDQDVLTFCIKEVLAFNYLAQPAITSAYSFPCQNGTYDVFVEGQGVAPLTYEITEKNNESFVVDNGMSNLFMGLEDAVYKFRVTDSCNNLSTVLLNLSSLAPLEITGDAFCEGEEVVLSLPQYTFLTYEWWKEDAPGVILSTNSSLVFPAFDGETQSGIYKVHIVATVQGSCIDLVLDKTVTPALVPNAGTSAELVFCNDGQDIDLNAYLGDSFDESGTWTDEDQTQVLTGNIVSTATLAPGTYHFKYTVNNACGLTDTSVITLHLKDQPSAPTAGFSGVQCEGEAIELYASGTEVEGATYSWSGPNNFTSTLRTPVLENVSPAMNGTYIVTQTLPGVECASAPAMVALTINEGPHFTLESDLQLCSGGKSMLRVVPSNFAVEQGDYQWFLDGSPLEGTDILAITEEGSYSVTVALGLCTTAQSLNVTFETNAFDVHLTTGCEAGKYVITIDEVAELAGASFTWSGPESYTSAEDHAEITGATTGDYSVMVTKPNGCTATATIPVSVTQCGNDNIPNGVSPNGDGKNDSFNLAGFGVDEIVIFNRYGLEVYRAANYTNEWYGQSDKGELPTATYFYALSLAGGKRVTGWVYLQR